MYKIRLMIGALLMVVAVLTIEPLQSAASASLEVVPVVPSVDSTMKARLRDLLADGLSKGNRPEVFAKVGDNLTAGADFMKPLGCKAADLAAHAELQPLVESTSAATLPANLGSANCANVDSFSRTSVAAQVAWRTDTLLGRATTAQCRQQTLSWLQCELSLLKPGIALIMFGTNDVVVGDLVAYRNNLNTIVAQTIAAGTIPVLSTIPPRLDRPVYVERVAQYNQVIIEVAQQQQILVMNYWLAMQAPDLVKNGLNRDGLTPNTAPAGAADFSAEGLRYGYNIRNFVALQTLATLRSVVVNDGPTDTPSATPSETGTATVTETPTETGTGTATVTGTATKTETALPTGTKTGTATKTTTSTRTTTPTRTPTSTRTATGTKTSTRTRTATRTPTITRTPTNTLTPTNTRTLLPTYTPNAQNETLYRMPVVPNIDEAMKTRLQGVLDAGVALGNRPNVFAQVGDSITAHESFLKPIGCGEEALSTHGDLQPVIDYFSAITMPVSYGSIDCGQANSFNRNSAVAMGGWRSWNAFDPATVADCPGLSNLECEIKLIRPGFAIIMFGSNDLLGPADFEANLSRVVEKSLELGTIPILSTIPPRYDHPELNLASRVVPFNLIIVDVAQKYQIPLLNYWLAMQSRNLVNYGLRGDGVHPNAYKLDDSTNFSSAGLAYGFNIRNLTAVQALAKMKAVLIDDGPTDQPIATMTPTITATPSLTPRPTNTDTSTPDPAIPTLTPDPAMPTSTPQSPTATMTLSPSGFSDVVPGDYYYDPVIYLVQQGAISGYTDHTFRPFNNTTRSQLAKIVLIAAGVSLISAPQSTFRDVPADNPFYSFIETAAARGIIAGYSCGDGCLEFKPFANVTRGQLAKIIVTTMGWATSTPPAPTFFDVTTTNPFYGQIETAYAHGIISGYADGSYRWGLDATRGQISKIVYAAIHK